MQLSSVEAKVSDQSFVSPYRRLFPQLNNAPQIAYLDSAATALRPAWVLDEEYGYLTSQYANSGRGQYPWAWNTDQIIRETREELLKFLKAEEGSVVFTSGATMSLNFVAKSWGAYNLSNGDEVLYCKSDHHSLTRPWQQLQAQLLRQGISIVLNTYELTVSGGIDYDSLRSVLTEKTRLVNVAHVNNTAGVVNDLSLVRAVVGSEVLLNVDIAQSISHGVVNLAEANVDFASFSGHKCFASTGIGGLYLSARVQRQMHEVFSGGGQAHNNFDSWTPAILEAGTLNIAGVVSLRAALAFMRSLDINRAHQYLLELTQYTYLQLLKRKAVELRYAVRPYELKDRIGVVSFSISGVNSQDVADFLAQYGVYVRSGAMCAGGPNEDNVRVSVQIYNDCREIDRLLSAIDELIGNV